ncbi:dihydrodipicolinate synthase family protein [Actinopolymorpha singaporensis]
MTGVRLNLPEPDGSMRPYDLTAPRQWVRRSEGFASRVAFAAAHVVADPFADNTPGAPARLDWDATLAFRRHLWAHGLGVADAMDTAQRGMGLTWDTTAELIRRSAAEAAACGGRVACGAGTDQLPALGGADTSGPPGLDEVVAAYEEQLAVVEDAAAQPILMASRHLAAVARDADDYRKVYDRLLAQVRGPVILHWLGPMFDPALTGYWGSADLAAATGTFLSLVRDHADVVDGVKVSLLDADHEIAVRSGLPTGVRLYTGDDFNYPDLIASGSDALLGIFAAIAPAAATALAALDAGDTAAYDEAFGPTVPLSRHLFGTPTYYYKTGICFLAWLSGHQEAFTMVGGLQSARSLPHLVEAFRLADRAGLLPDPDLAAARMRTLLALHGVAA